VIWGVEDSTVLGLAAIIAGLGVGFGTALISFWWNYKTRGLSHQQFLYQKQIEAYPRVLASIANVMQPCYDFLLVHHNVLTTEDREKMRLEVEKLLQEHTLGLDRDLVLLPSEVIRSINKLNGTLRDLTTYGTTERAVDGRIMVVQIADPSGALRDAHLRVINAIREEARIETLSKMDWIVGPRRPGTNEFDD
jgi:hypothetical protein